MPKEVKSIRWTVQLACTETGVHRDTITKGIKANAIQPGEDGKYGTQQIMSAIYGSAKLEREAREAKFRQQIDEADTARMDKEAKEGTLILKSHARNVMADGLTKVAQIIRQSGLREAEKKECLSEIAAVKLEEPKIVKFRDAA